MASMRSRSTNRGVRVLAGLGSLVALLTGLVGIPAALWFFGGGSPLPETVPTPGEVWAALTKPDDGQLFFDAVVVVGWLAWLSFAGPALLELVTQVVGRRPPNLPLLRAQQRLAAGLVTAVILMLSGPAAASAKAGPLALRPAVTLAVQHTELTAAPTPATAPDRYVEHVVQREEVALLDLAERYGVPPEELARANLGIAQPDGRSLQPGQARLYPGWTMRIPAGAAAAANAVHDAHRLAPASSTSELAQYEVSRDDWMYFVAERYLGDGNRYPEIEQLNRQYEDANEAFPDHIEATWRLTLPGDAHDRGPRAHATGNLVRAVPSDPSTTAAAPRQSVGDSVTPTPTPTPTQAAAPETPAVAAVPTPPPATAPTPITAPATGPAVPTPVAPSDLGLTATDGDITEDADMYVALALGTASLLAALAFFAVQTRRRRARQHHRPGLRVAMPLAGTVERDIRTAQRPLDVSRLDAALRNLATGLIGRPGPLPDPVGALVDGDGIHLLLAANCPQPPLPWQDHSDQWVLPDTVEVTPAAGDIAPLPSLTAVGSIGAAHVLLDLERIGCLTVHGPDERRADLLRYIAAELALNTWSDEVDLVLAGLGRADAEHLIALNPSRIRVATSIAEAVARVGRRATSASATLTAGGVADALAGRIADVAADAWMPTILIVADPDAAALASLRDLDAQLAQVGRCGVGAVIATGTSEPVGRWTITVDRQGGLGLPFPAPVGLNAAALPQIQLERLGRLMADARDSAEVDVPAAPETEPWAGGTDAAGRLLPTPAGATDPDPDSDAAGNGSGRPAGMITVAIPAAEPRRVVSAAVRQRSRQTDPGLDADLRAWRDATSTRPRIGILGPVTVDAPGPRPDERQRFHAEVIVYLAQRGARGADREQLDEALWPDRNVEAATRRVAIMRARRWLGDAEDGEPWLPDMGPDRSYRLRDGYLLDWHLFRRLRARGEAHGPAGVKDLRAALELVRGEPLDGADRPYAAKARNPYMWLPMSDIHPDHIVAAVIDTAHQLAESYLDAGDTDGARWAVDQAWRADPGRGYDLPWRDLLRALHGAGHTAALRAAFGDLMRIREAEVPEDLDAETYQVALEVLPDVLRAGAEAVG